MTKKKNVNILVIGGGAREHALVWKLAQSPLVAHLYAAPGNVGMCIGASCLANGKVIQRIDCSADSFFKIAQNIRECHIDIVVVGPELPLVLGLKDYLAYECPDVFVWGPNEMAARLEGSKAFADDFMSTHGIPHPVTYIYHGRGEYSHALERCAYWDHNCVIKADGLAGGKGVFVCSDAKEAKDAVDRLLIDRAFGTAGDTILIQEKLVGEEMSVHVWMHNDCYHILPTSRDYKRLLNGDTGPNTGGMGGYAPAGTVPGKIHSIIRRFITGCQMEGIEYTGTLYIGLMLTSDGPKVLEFNVRMGDPETQLLMPLLKTDLAHMLIELAHGNTNVFDTIKWSDDAVVGVVLAGENYPFKDGHMVMLSADFLSEHVPQRGVHLFHSQSVEDTPPWIINAHSGRITTVVGRAPTLKEARGKALGVIKRHRRSLGPVRFRTDIAQGVS